MIQLYHVYKAYDGDSQALSDVTFEIEKGGFAFLTGPSGAGKSTLLKLLYAAEQPTSGQVLVGGRNISRLRPGEVPFLRRNIGVVFQDFKLIGQHTVEENVAIALRVRYVPEHAVQRRVAQMLRVVGLLHKRKARAVALSGGEQQRVAIARALINDPQILLADEPTGNLDPEKAEETMQLLQECNVRGSTVLVATHDVQLLQRYARRLLVLQAGKLVDMQEPSAIR